MLRVAVAPRAWLSIAGLVCVNVRSFREGEDWHPHGMYYVLGTMYYFVLSIE